MKRIRISAGVRGGVAFVALSLNLLPTTPWSAFAAEPKEKITVAAIVRQLAEYQERVKTCEFAWTERITVPKESRVATEPAPPVENHPGVRPPKILLIPEQEKTFEAKSLLVMDGDNFRSESDSLERTHRAPFLVLHHSTSTEHDGRGENLDYYDGDYIQGAIHNVEPRSYARSGSLGPLFLIFRGCATRQFQPEEYTLAPEGGEIDGHACVILVKKFPGGSTSLWIDVERGCLILREAMESRHFGFTSDVQYRQDSQTGWIPQRWKVTSLGEHGALYSTKDAVVQRSTINKPVDPATFKIKFPPGAWVRDETGNKDGGNDNTQRYLVDADGTLTPTTGFAAKFKDVDAPPPIPPTPYTLGDPAPKIEVNRWTDGKTRSLADFRGKAVVMVFTGAWCTGCRQAAGRLRQLEDHFKDREVVMFGVHTPVPVDRNAIIDEMLRDDGWPLLMAVDEPLADLMAVAFSNGKLAPKAYTEQVLLRVAHFGSPLSNSDTVLGKTAENYGVYRWPNVVVIDRQGRVVFCDDLYQRNSTREGREANKSRLAEQVGIEYPWKQKLAEEAKIEFENRIEFEFYREWIERALAAGS